MYLYLVDIMLLLVGLGVASGSVSVRSYRLRVGLLSGAWWAWWWQLIISNISIIAHISIIAQRTEPPQQSRATMHAEQLPGTHQSIPAQRPLAPAPPAIQQRSPSHR
jgi:hypothetical protein